MIWTTFSCASPWKQRIEIKCCFFQRNCEGFWEFKKTLWPFNKLCFFHLNILLVHFWMTRKLSKPSVWLLGRFIRTFRHTIHVQNCVTKNELYCFVSVSNTIFKLFWTLVMLATLPKNIAILSKSSTKSNAFRCITRSCWNLTWERRWRNSNFFY